MRRLHYPDVLRVEIRFPSLTETRTFAHGIGIRDDKQVSVIQLASMIPQVARLSIPRILHDGKSRGKRHVTSAVWRDKSEGPCFLSALLRCFIEGRAAERAALAE